MKVNAKGIHYKLLNEKIHMELARGLKKISLIGVNGQRFIASGVDAVVEIKINGIPGNDLGAFMNGPQIYVDGNAQDAVGNTMSGGTIVINGHTGDAAGYSMRGGKIFIKSNVGYRVGINMKQYKGNIPVIVIGGRAKDFLGEYMAGGILIVLGLNSLVAAGKLIGTGMHGGKIYIPRNKIPQKLPQGISVTGCNRDDLNIIDLNIKEYLRYFKSPSLSPSHFRKCGFLKLTPTTHRPYGNLYAY